MPKFIYLHGFLSHPRSTKSIYFGRQFSKLGLSLSSPDLNFPSISNLTVSAQIDLLEKNINNCHDDEVFIIGSSLGGAVAVNFYQTRPKNRSKVRKLVLLSPAFDFIGSREILYGQKAMRDWKRNGKIEIVNFIDGGHLTVNYSLIEDAARYDSFSSPIDIPTLIFHGIEDHEVPNAQSVRFASLNSMAILQLIKSDHSLQNSLAEIWAFIFRFFELNRYVKPKIEVSIKEVDFSCMEDRNFFESCRPGFINVLRTCYGEDFYGEEIHIRRLYEESQILYLAFVKGEIVGVMYMKPDGKISSFAVLPEFRGLGIGQSVLCQSFNKIHSQFIEILPILPIKKLLINCGFIRVNSQEKIRQLLGRDAKGITTFEVSDQNLVYNRRSTTLAGRQHRFVLYEYPPAYSFFENQNG